MAFATYLIYLDYKKQSGIKKEQNKLMVIGLIISTISASSNFPLWYDIPIPPILNILSGFFVYLTAYSIIRFRFFDIKLVFRQSTVYFFSLATLVLPAITLSYIFYFFFPEQSIWFSAFVFIIVIFLFDKSKKFFGRIANKYFFTSLYDGRELTARTSEQLSSTIELSRIYEYIIDAVTNKMKIDRIAFLIYSRKNNSFRIDYKPADWQKINLLELSRFVDFKDEKNRVFVIEELTHEPEFKNKLEAEKMFRLGFGLVVSLKLKDQLLGLLVLGQKNSREPYNDEDLAVISLIANQFSFALNNALLLDKTEKINLKLREEQEKTSAIIKNLVDPIIVLNKNNEIILFNKSAEDVLGLKRTDIGKKIKAENNFSLNNFTGIIKKEYTVKDTGTKINGNPVEEINLGPKKQTDDKSQYNLLKNQKYEHTFKVVTATIYGRYKKTYGHMKIFYDITRERYIDMIKSEFITIAAHQLRTPLSAVKWALRMTIDEELGKINQAQKDLLDKGYESNERVINVINDMLDVSRIEDGKFGYEFDDGELKEVIDKLLDRLKPQVENKKIKVKADIPEQFPKIHMDKEKMELALENIVTNAILYTPEQGKIDIRLEQKDGQALLSVSDNGIGISDEEQTQLFEKFFRGENAVRLQTEGSGLGLFITKNIIEKHEGTISIKSREGVGTTVEIRLPV
jgi:signal transduction histidine kinase